MRGAISVWTIINNRRNNNDKIELFEIIEDIMQIPDIKVDDRYNVFGVNLLFMIGIKNRLVINVKKPVDPNINPFTVVGNFKISST